MPVAYATASLDDSYERVSVFPCLFEGCGKFYASAEDLQGHIDEHMATVKCPMDGCAWPNAPLEKWNSLCRHMSATHGETLLPLQEVFLCRLRGCEQQIFMNRWNLTRHNEAHVRAMGGAGKKAEPERKGDFDFLASLI